MQKTQRPEPADPDTALKPQTESSPQWPGERHPTRWDVHDAHENLATTFLERYKILLLDNEQSQGCRVLISPPREDETGLGDGPSSNGLDTGLVIATIPKAN